MIPLFAPRFRPPVISPMLLPDPARLERSKTPISVTNFRLNSPPPHSPSYNKRQMSRIYPRGNRVDSSNFMPQVSAERFQAANNCATSLKWNSTGQDFMLWGKVEKIGWFIHNVVEWKRWRKEMYFYCCWRVLKCCWNGRSLSLKWNTCLDAAMHCLCL